MDALVAFILSILGAIGYFLLIRAFYQMRDFLREISVSTQAQLEIMRTHTKLLASTNATEKRSAMTSPVTDDIRLQKLIEALESKQRR